MESSSNHTFDCLDDPTVLQIVHHLKEENKPYELALFYAKAGYRLAFLQGLISKAIPFYEGSIRVLLDIPEDSIDSEQQYIIPKVYCQLAQLHTGLHNLEQADSCWEKCFDNIELLNSIDRYDTILRFIPYCSQRGWVQEATKVVFSILELESIGEICKHKCHHHLALLYAQCADFKNALIHASLGCEKISEPYSVFDVHCLITKCFVELGLCKVKKAKKSLRLAMQIHDSMDIKHEAQKLDFEELSQLCKEAKKLTKRSLREKISNTVMGKIMKPCKGPRWIRRMASFVRKQKHCAYCGNNDPRAILMICKGCEKARYCNDDCYMKHWKEHKKDCKK